jgi:hypothetical protein
MDQETSAEVAVCDPGGSYGLECVLPTAGSDRANDAYEGFAMGTVSGTVLGIVPLCLIVGIQE